METASLLVGVVLSGTMSHVIVSDKRKAPRVKGKGKDINSSDIKNCCLFLVFISWKINLRYNVLKSNIGISTECIWDLD